MGKVLAAVFLATAVIGGSVALYTMRHRLLRPDVRRVGGTRVVLAVAGDAEAVAAALSDRFDPTEGEGIVATPGPGSVAIDVPDGRRRGENLERVRRTVRRPGRLRVGMLANAEDDGEALEAAKAWLTPANRTALEAALTAGDPLPALEGRFVGKGPAAGTPRYRWVAADAMRASMSVGGNPGSHILAREHFSLWHEFKPPGRVIHFVLFRELPDGEGVRNDDVVRPRVVDQGGVRYATVLFLPFDADGGRRLAAAMTKQASPPAKASRTVALVLDDDVLVHFMLGVTVPDMKFTIRMEDKAHGDDVTALLRAPLPDGARVSVEKEQALPGR